MCYFKTLMTFIIILSFHNHSPWKLNHWLVSCSFPHMKYTQNNLATHYQWLPSGVSPFSCSILWNCHVLASAKQKQWNDSPRHTKKIKWRSVWLCIECFEHSKISLIELHELYCLFKGQQPNTYELITPYIKQLNPNLLNSLK